MHMYVRKKNRCTKKQKKPSILSCLFPFFIRAIRVKATQQELPYFTSNRGVHPLFRSFDTNKSTYDINKQANEVDMIKKAYGPHVGYVRVFCLCQDSLLVRKQHSICECLMFFQSDTHVNYAKNTYKTERIK